MSNSVMQKTKITKINDLKADWLLIDADNKSLGRLSVLIADKLMGKEKINRADNLFSGFNVVVINAKKIRVNAKKEKTKQYYRHSGYPGGLKSLTLEQLREKNASVILTQAIKGMVPKSNLGKSMLDHLYVYNDAVHPHEAQSPVLLEV